MLDWSNKSFNLKMLNKFKEIIYFILFAFVYQIQSAFKGGQIGVDILTPKCFYFTYMTIFSATL